MLGKATHGQVGKAMVGEVGEAALGEAGEASLGKVAHGEASETILFKIHSRVGTWWRRSGLAF